MSWVIQISAVSPSLCRSSTTMTAAAVFRVSGTASAERYQYIKRCLEPWTKAASRFCLFEQAAHPLSRQMSAVFSAYLAGTA